MFSSHTRLCHVQQSFEWQFRIKRLQYSAQVKEISDRNAQENLAYPRTRNDYYILTLVCFKCAYNYCCKYIKAHHLFWNPSINFWNPTIKLVIWITSILSYVVHKIANKPCILIIYELNNNINKFIRCTRHQNLENENKLHGKYRQWSAINSIIRRCVWSTICSLTLKQLTKR